MTAFRLFLAVLCIFVPGCYSAKIAALQNKVIDLGNKIDDVHNGLHADDKAILQTIRNVENYLSERIYKCERSIFFLEDFRSDHDKRWPPPAKLK